MFRLIETVSRYRGMTMAVGVGSAVVLALSAMLVMGVDSKVKEGRASPYGSGKAGHDMLMTSADVSAIVSIPKPGKGRLPRDAVQAVPRPGNGSHK